MLPRAPQIETLIEFAHRLTSGLALLLVVVALLWGWRAYPKGHPVRQGIVLSFTFMITEALVGAALVLFEWVAYDASIGRVISISIHLVNTFLLLASLALTAWWASGGPRLRLHSQGATLWGLGFGFMAMFALGISGAITALGDTLFPAETLAQGLQQDFSPTAHFLIRLRVWHPVIAIVTGLYLVFLALLINGFRPHPATRKLAWAISGLFLAQLLAGLINLVLLAPVWMQLVHLLLADAVWLTLVLLAASTLRQKIEPTHSTPNS